MERNVGYRNLCSEPSAIERMAGSALSRAVPLERIQDLEGNGELALSDQVVGDAKRFGRVVLVFVLAGIPFHEGEQSPSNPCVEMAGFERVHLFFEFFVQGHPLRWTGAIQGQILEGLAVVGGYVGLVGLPVEEIENLLALPRIRRREPARRRVRSAVECARLFDSGDLLDEVQESRGDLASLLVGVPQHLENEPVRHPAQQILHHGAVALYRTLLVGGVEKLVSDGGLEFLEKSAQIPQVGHTIRLVVPGSGVPVEMFLHGLLVTVEGHLVVEAVFVQVRGDDARRVVVRTSQGDSLLRICQCAENEVGHKAAPERIVLIGVLSTGALLNLLFFCVQEFAVVDALDPDVTNLFVGKGLFDSPLRADLFRVVRDHPQEGRQFVGRQALPEMSDRNVVIAQDGGELVADRILQLGRIPAHDEAVLVRADGHLRP